MTEPATLGVMPRPHEARSPFGGKMQKFLIAFVAIMILVVLSVHGCASNGDPAVVHISHGSVRGVVAEFADPDSPRDPIFPPQFPQGTPHGAEVPYLMDLGKEDLGLSSAQQSLSERMIIYWSAFAYKGISTRSDIWPQASGAEPAALEQHGSGDRAINPMTKHRCEIWNRLK